MIQTQLEENTSLFNSDRAAQKLCEIIDTKDHSNSQIVRFH